MTSKLTPPAPLDNTKIHTREEFRRWQDANYEYHEAIAAEEQIESMKAAAKKATASRTLTDDEYFAMAVQREEARKARMAELEAERQAAADAKAAYLASMPDVADICENNPYSFITQICFWANRGYTLPENADLTMLPTFNSISLNKPVSAKKAK